MNLNPLFGRSARILPIALTALMATAALAQSPGDSPVSAMAAVKTATVARGGKGTLAITVTIKPGYHVNSVAPGDPDLIPASIKAESAGGVTFGKPVFPAAKTITAAGKPIHVYMGTAVMTIPFTVAASAKPGKHTVNATFSYQSCNDTMCLPPADAPVSAVVTVK